MDRLIPKSHKLYLGLAKFGLKRAYKSTGADLIGFRPDASGNLKPDPMQVQHDVGPENSNKFKAKSDGQLYDLGTESVTGEYIGKTPVGFFVDDPPRQVSLLESRVRDAIDLEQFDGIYTDPDVYLNEVIVEDESVLADGGMGNAGEGQVARRTFDVDRDVLPDDVLVDLSSDGDGARVSWRRVNDILHERVSTEEMQMQEERGLIAGKSSEEVKKMAIYALMAIVGVVAILVLGPPIVQNIFGNGGGGGGGGMIPILLGGFM